MGKKKETTPESVVRQIKRNTRKKYGAEEKIRIVLEGLRGESSIADICGREGIHTTQYYKWSKAFLESGKRQLSGDTLREANRDEVQALRKDNEELKQLVAELSLQNRMFKKAVNELE